jgi:hypothetical protein
MECGGVPTVVGFANREEILRRSGIQSTATLDILFEAAHHQPIHYYSASFG